MSRIQLSADALPGFNGVEAFKKKVSDPRLREKVLNKWATDYLRSMNARHRTLSLGGGVWPELNEVYKARKIARGGHPGILRDTDQLLGATRPNGYGQLRRLDVQQFSLTIGIADVPYTHPYPRKKHPRTLGQLARFHAATGRQIIVPPSPKLREKMKQTALIVWLKQR